MEQALNAEQRRALHVLAYMMLRMGQEERAGRIYAALAALELPGGGLTGSPLPARQRRPCSVETAQRRWTAFAVRWMALRFLPAVPLFT